MQQDYRIAMQFFLCLNNQKRAIASSQVKFCPSSGWAEINKSLSDR